MSTDKVEDVCGSTVSSGAVVSLVIKGVISMGE